MTRRQRTQVVEERADVLLADERSAEGYAVYFEDQMRPGRVRRLLVACWLRLARDGMVLAGSGPPGIGAGGFTGATGD